MLNENPTILNSKNIQSSLAYNDRDLNNWLDFSGLMPPLPAEVAKKIEKKINGNFNGKHTFLPYLITRNEFNETILPSLKSELDIKLVNFIKERVEKTFEIRNKLKQLQTQIFNIVGKGNFSALWLDREAFSADSMEHRALITEAVIHIYSIDSLQKIVELLYRHKIPMIPYGEGGGYNMGVTPMAPAVTISMRGIDHISEIKPSRKNNQQFEISVGAGVPFKDLVFYLAKRGFVLRCDPNTPRAATGGIAATGSNGGRKAFEVIVHGRAVTANGTAVCFALDSYENEIIENEPFLLARKFFSIEDTQTFKENFSKIQKKKLNACSTPNLQGISVPLQGMKASANMIAQKVQSPQNKTDCMQDAPTLPISAFIGAEGTTGFIYEVTFEIEKPLPYLQGSQWNFKSVPLAMAATQAIKKLQKNEQPEYFEFISGESIRRYLLQDFPSVFSVEDEAVIILGIEGTSKEDCEKKHNLIEKIINTSSEGHISRFHKTSCMLQSENMEEFEILKKPREELPKKLRTKCKTDMEIRTEYLAEVLTIVANTKPKSSIQKQDVLFGHLTPNHTSIIHWNIGGFDLYDEDQSDIAWDYLEKVFEKAHGLAPATDQYPSAQFTGEHGVAGKAPFLWLNYIPKNDFERMCKIKDTLDPENLFNPETLFLRTTHARSLRARLLNTSANFIQKSLQTNQNNDEKLSTKSLIKFQEDKAQILAENYSITEGQRCTRCNSCKICPVIDAEHELEKEGKRKSKNPILPSKRNILMFMEHIAHLRKNVKNSGNSNALKKITQVTNKMFKESTSLLSKCFYCRRCDKACPVDIEINPLTKAFRTMGKLPSSGSKMWGFLYERLMGEDFFKPLTYRLVAFVTLISMPILFLLRKIKFIPDWLKTYTVPPTLSLIHYEPLNTGKKIEPSNNFVVINKEKNSENFVGHEKFDNETVYIRYRGCMDTFGKPAATTAVDSFFKDVLNARIVDLEKKMCCGFPFEADGLHDRAKQSRIASMVEIAKCIYRLSEEYSAAESAIHQFIVFSNCPTCCEAIREMKDLLKEEELCERIRVRAKIPSTFDMQQIQFKVQDTAEISLKLLKLIQKNDNELYAQPENKCSYKSTQELTTESIQIPAVKAPNDKELSDIKVGLKVPCHNTKDATKAQIEILKMYFKDVSSFDRCCGLSGTGRLKHPKIGTKISEKLFEQIEEFRPDVVVSGCPSCRDGVKIQRDILQAQSNVISEFEITGIFEQIMSVKS